MITAERKPFDEIYGYVNGHNNILVLGCGSCVTVCMAGGEKEVGILASQIKLAASEKGDTVTVDEHTIMRQCDAEFFDEETTKKIEQADAVLSIACGVGVQFSVEQFNDKIIYPGLNTTFYGATIQQGVWSERCAGCGECVIGDFGGVCPIARCSKSLLNGPCGGSAEGMCEVDQENIDCAWQLIYDRMAKLGRLDDLTKNRPLKDWSTGRDGGPRKIVREDLLID
ncbi:methylenetetrahydrofolate reductase C-terminal domain-containing protein [Candidatus Latescibacterota bacterium]